MEGGGGRDEPECDTVFWAEFFEFSHDAVCDTWYACRTQIPGEYTLVHRCVARVRNGARAVTFGVETVHHAAHELELVLQTEVDEVGVDEDAVWRDEGGVVCEEEGRGDRVAAYQ